MILGFHPRSTVSLLVGSRKSHAREPIVISSALVEEE